MNKIKIFLISLLLISCGGTAENLTVGDKAPDFTLQDSQGNSYTLSSYQNQSPVIVYFYPKANTPGCTTEACGIRDDYAKFEENGIKVFGISVDSKKDIQEFINDHNLNFPLLSDETKEVAKKYGVLNELGKASRVTFIVDKEGKLAHIIRDVDVTTHSDQVFELANKLP
ncbi:MAG: peroxiredoxin [Ignavibacteriales bacterium]|nr:peroxiredoxin [Ignavibacteriales bacterium]